MALTLEAIAPLGTKLLARRYERPEATPGGITIPETLRVDETFSLWECVRCGPKVGRTLGIVPSADDILHTPAWRGVFVATIDEVDYYMLEEADVRAVQRW
jgi:co-chaperonin GroES (HSP10)